MKKIATILAIVLILSLALPFMASAASTSTNNFSGHRPYSSNTLKAAPSWLAKQVDEYGAEFYVNPNAPVSRLDVFLSIARMLENKFKRDGIEFSSGNYMMFSDLNHLSYDCIPLTAGLYNRGILRGYGDDTARLTQSITRAEFTAVINRLAHLTGRISYNGNYNYDFSRFTDIKGSWAETAIVETVAAGLMNGVSANKFDPQGLVTYAQLFKVLTTLVDDEYGLQKYDVAYGCTNTWDIDFSVTEESSNVKKPITSLKASKTTIYVNVGETVTAKVRIYPAEASNKTLSWEAKADRVVFITDYYTEGEYAYVTVEGNKEGTTYIVGSATDGSEKMVKIKVIVNDDSSENDSGNTDSGNTDSGNTGSDDTKAPLVQLMGANSVSVGQMVELTVKVEEDDLASFKITERDILGLTGGLSINKIEKVSDNIYKIKLMGVEVSAAELCIAAGVAVDKAGNKSVESNGVVIYINSGEE